MLQAKVQNVINQTLPCFNPKLVREHHHLLLVKKQTQN